MGEPGASCEFGSPKYYALWDGLLLLLVTVCKVFANLVSMSFSRMYTLESSEKRTHTSTKPRFIWRLLLLPSSLLISLFLLWSPARCGFRPVPLALSQPHLGKQPPKFTQQRDSMVSTNLWFLCGDVKFHT